MSSVDLLLHTGDSAAGELPRAAVELPRAPTSSPELFRAAELPVATASMPQLPERSLSRAAEEEAQELTMPDHPPEPVDPPVVLPALKRTHQEMPAVPGPAARAMAAPAGEGWKLAEDDLANAEFNVLLNGLPEYAAPQEPGAVVVGRGDLKRKVCFVDVSAEGSAAWCNAQLKEAEGRGVAVVPIGSQDETIRLYHPKRVAVGETEDYFKLKESKACLHGKPVKVVKPYRFSDDELLQATALGERVARELIPSEVLTTPECVFDALMYGIDAQASSELPDLFVSETLGLRGYAGVVPQPSQLASLLMRFFINNWTTTMQFASITAVWVRLVIFGAEPWRAAQVAVGNVARREFATVVAWNPRLGAVDVTTLQRLMLETLRAVTCGIHLGRAMRIWGVDLERMTTLFTAQFVQPSRWAKDRLARYFTGMRVILFRRRMNNTFYRQLSNYNDHRPGDDSKSGSRWAGHGLKGPFEPLD